MIPKIAFILAAGLGTRMGPDGKKVPKPLWQIYNKSILEILVAQVEQLGIEQVYINSHHLHSMIEQYCSEKKLNINIIFEKDLLGSGGCFFNLKKLVGNERVLALNGDSFFLINKSEFDQEALSSSGHLLFARKLSPEHHYNGFKFEGAKLQGIVTPPHREDYWTFAGVSLIDLSLIDGEVEPCSFFDRVVVPGQPASNISFINSPFFDFGTLEEYCKGCLLAGKSGELRDFLSITGVDLGHASEKRSSFSIEKQSGKIEVKFEVLGQVVSVATQAID